MFIMVIVFLFIVFFSMFMSFCVVIECGILLMCILNFVIVFLIEDFYYMFLIGYVM